MKNKFLQLMVLGVLMVGMLSAGSYGMVLCIGADGHVAVEPEQHSHCGHTHDEAGHEHDGAELRDAETATCENDGCADVPLGIEQLTETTKPCTQDRLEKIGACRLFLIAYDSFTQNGAHRHQRTLCGTTSVLARSLLEKRSIVLRI